MGRSAAVTGVLDLLMAYMAFEAGMTINVWDGMFGAVGETP